MEKFDLGIAFVWEYDDEFVDRIEAILHKAKLTTYRIVEANLAETQKKVQQGDLQFAVLLDRASDVDDLFLKFGKLLLSKKTVIINPYKKVEHAIDKASMHLEYISAGLNVPFSVIIDPHSKRANFSISIQDWFKLSRPFIYKPCNTHGGGIGVVTGAEHLQDVIAARAANTEDKYLLQEFIHPSFYKGKRNWFRTYYAFGHSIIVRWDDHTHRYELLSDEEISALNIQRLHKATKKIGRLTGMDFFSTEMAVTEKNKVVVIDYMNDQCDMRLSSNHEDGVPDCIVDLIITHLKNFIIRKKKKTADA